MGLLGRTGVIVKRRPFHCVTPVKRLHRGSARIASPRCGGATGSAQMVSPPSTESTAPVV